MRALPCVLTVLLGLCFVLAPPPASAGPAQDMIENLARSAEPILNDRDIVGAERAERLQALVGAVLNRDQMARSLMGRYWHRATDAQRAELSKLLERYLIDVYASRVDAFDGEISFAVDGERALADRTLVETRVIRAGEPSVSVVWQVEDVEGRPTVTDILVEGVSLIVSQRADFASVIRNQGGIDGLIGLLRKKVGS